MMMLISGDGLINMTKLLSTGAKFCPLLTKLLRNCCGCFGVLEWNPCIPPFRGTEFAPGATPGETRATPRRHGSVPSTSATMFDTICVSSLSFLEGQRSLSNIYDVFYILFYRHRS